MTKLRRRKCKHCKEYFMPDMEGAIACTIKCAVELSRTQQRKEFAAETRRRREAIKTITKLETELQHAVNRYVRARDYFQPCISCDRRTGAQMQAGHYRPKSGPDGVPMLRFNLINLNLQCVQCNDHLSGNHVGYRAGLVKRYGERVVTWLDGCSGPHTLTSTDLRELKVYYNRRAGQFEKWNQEHAWLFDPLPEVLTT